METIQLRPPIPSPLVDHDSPTTNNHVILFKHPAYPDEYEQNTLLQLYAWDTTSGALHAGTALLACSLIACNAWDGYLTIEREGPRLQLDDDHLLPAGEYFFHVPKPSDSTGASPDYNRGYYKYPIYPSFQHWAFPHRRVPTQWGGQNESGNPSGTIINTPSISSVTAAVINRDKSCIVSKERDYIQRAHLCPRNELDWFRKNGMKKYNARLDISGDVITDDVANAVTMIPGIHQAFDDGKFTLVRKSGRWTIHFLEKTYNLGRKYHNVPIELVGISPEFVLTRFAWAIFPLVRTFMEQGPERVVKVREQYEHGLREVVKTLDIAGFELMGAASRGRSWSPKKRKAADPSTTAGAKRQCVDFQSVIESNEDFPPGSSSQEGCTPNLCFDEGTSIGAYGASQLSSIHPAFRQEECSDVEADAEADRISTLRRDGLRKGRPNDLSLLCCNYDLAEQANALGIPGKPEYGGGHLCMKCLGFEGAC